MSTGVLPERVDATETLTVVAAITKNLFVSRGAGITATLPAGSGDEIAGITDDGADVAGGPTGNDVETIRVATAGYHYVLTDDAITDGDDVMADTDGTAIAYVVLAGNYRAGKAASTTTGTAGELLLVDLRNATVSSV